MSRAKIGFLSLAMICSVCGGIGLLRAAQMGPLSLWIHLAVLGLGVGCLAAGLRQR